jgi:hypothetical protein
MRIKAVLWKAIALMDLLLARQNIIQMQYLLKRQMLAPGVNSRMYLYSGSCSQPSRHFQGQKYLGSVV